jgi:hypothetical protein
VRIEGVDEVMLGRPRIVSHRLCSLQRELLRERALIENQMDIGAG